MTHTENLEPSEVAVRDLLERSMNGTTAPSELAHHALNQGRAMRKRRRAGITAATAGTVAVTLAALIVPNLVGAGPSAVVGPAGEPSGGASSAGSAAPAELTEGWWNQPAPDMINALQAILPDGVVVTSPGPLTITPDSPARGLVVPELQAPTGPGRLLVMLFPRSADSPAPGESVQDPGGAALTGVGPQSLEFTLDRDTTARVGDHNADLRCSADLGGRTTCEQLWDEQGKLVGRRLSSRWGDTVMNEVVLLRHGGFVYAAAANTVDMVWGADSLVSTEKPPLTLKQLNDLASNDTWVMPAT